MSGRGGRVHDRVARLASRKRGKTAASLALRRPQVVPRTGLDSVGVVLLHAGELPSRWSSGSQWGGAARAATVPDLRGRPLGGAQGTPLGAHREAEPRKLFG